MSLNKQPVNINFSQGLETKMDPFQLPPGKFLKLQNTVFQKGGLLQKRNGFGSLASLPDSTATYATTFNGDLTAIGTKLEAYSSGSMTWVNKGNIQPLKLDTLSLIKSNTNQSQADCAVSVNGLVCTVFTDNLPSGGSTAASYKYVIADSVTGQNIVAPTVIPVATGAIASAPRVFLLGSYFVIVFNNVISNTSHLQYIAISTINPTTVTANTNISSTLLMATPTFDGFVANNNLYLAWNGASTTIHVTYIRNSLSQGSTVDFTSSFADHISVTADLTASTPIIYVSYYKTSGTAGYVLALNQNLGTVLAPTQIISSGTILHLASTAQNAVVTVFYEVSNNYSYDSGVASHFISSITCTQAGSVGSAGVVLRSVGLASKAFLMDAKSYFLCAYSSSYQPTYFLSDSTGKVIAKLAYSNGGGYYSTALPSASVSGSTVKIPYLIKDFIAAVNKNTNVAAGNQVNGIYSQTGVNLATFAIGTSNIIASEIGQNLHLTGGFLWMYDGYLPVEHNFFLWPDNVELVGVSTAGAMTAQQYFYQATYEWSDNQGNIHRSAPSIPVSYTITAAPVSFTGTRTSGSPTLGSVSSFTGLQVGQPISGTGIPANTYILSMNTGSSTVTMSANASSGTATSTTVTPTTLASLTINVPTLRLTYKTANPVKIVIYRWSTAQQTYYQVTSLTVPILNDKTVDSVSFVDSSSDATILGNNIIYTNGGVVENIGAPAASAITLFDDRLFLLDAEDGTIWFSKQVIPSVPVEMSDLLTQYIAPTIGAGGSTGNVKCMFPMDDKIIYFKGQAIYYQNGSGPDNTGNNNGYSQPIFITSSVGCSNQNSIVMTPSGLMFQSDKGIYLLGRDLSTQYIGAPVEEFNSATVLSALNVPATTQVRFTLDSGVTLMYDYYYQQWGTFVGIPGVSSTLYQGLHTYIDKFGQAFQESVGTYLDGGNPVLVGFTTSWLNLAGLQGYQRIYEFYLLGTYVSPHKLNVQVAYDYAPWPSQSTIISPQNYSPVYGLDPVYGLLSPYGGQSVLERWRVFTQQQRCSAFQIILSEIYDPSYTVPAGAGLTLSGLDCVVGIKKGWKPIAAANSVG